MILKGDCIKVTKAMKSNSVDAIVTDSPYGRKDSMRDKAGEDW